VDRGINGYPSGAARTALDGAEVDRQPVPFVADDTHHHIRIRLGTALPRVSCTGRSRRRGRPARWADPVAAMDLGRRGRCGPGSAALWVIHRALREAMLRKPLLTDGSVIRRCSRTHQPATDTDSDDDQHASSDQPRGAHSIRSSRPPIAGK